MVKHSLLIDLIQNVVETLKREGIVPRIDLVQSVVETLEWEGRFPLKKRTLTMSMFDSCVIPCFSSSSSPINSSSPTLSSVIENLVTKTENPKVDILDVLPTKNLPNPIRKPKRCLLPKQQQKKAKRKNNSRFEVGVSSYGAREPTPEWLVELMRFKNGKNPKHIIDKGLTVTDVKSNNHRLSMPCSQIMDLDFLSPDEEKIIAEDANKVRKVGVDAILVTFDLKEFKLKLRRWDMESSSVYNLTSGWNNVVACCGLKKNNNISLWSFHADNKLYFAIAIAPPPPSPSTISSSACVR